MRLFLAFVFAAGCAAPMHAFATAANAWSWHQDVMGSTCMRACGEAVALWDGRQTCVCQRALYALELAPGALQKAVAWTVDLCTGEVR